MSGSDPCILPLSSIHTGESGLDRERRMPGARVWFVALTPCMGHWTRALPLVSEETRNRVAARRQPRDAARTVLAELLLLLALTRDHPSSSPKETRIIRDAAGAPRVIPFPGVHVSITHAGDVVAVATSGQPIGLDVELDSRAGAWLDRALTPEERAQWRARDPLSHPIEAWCRKEALLKMRGVGLRMDPRTVTCPRTHGDATFSDGTSCRVFFQALTTLPGHRSVVAAPVPVAVDVTDATHHLVDELTRGRERRIHPVHLSPVQE